MIEIPDVHETEIDGVRTFWVDTPPPLTGALIFRVGAWDERPPIRGITHIVEHLALFDHRNADHPYNGSVSGPVTTFWASGKPGDVTRFLSTVSATLGSLPTDRLKTESKILAAEAAQRGQSEVDHMLNVFFGPNGPGLSGYHEWGLERLGAGEIQAWADRYFNRNNAVLMLSQEPPADLRLDLPAGQPSHFELPPDDVGYRPTGMQFIGSRPTGVGLGALVERSTAAVSALQLAARHLTEHIRHQQGLAYSVEPVYVPLDEGTAFACLGADAEPAHAVRLAEAFIDTFRRYAVAGPSVTDMAWLRRTHEDSEVDAIAFARAEMEQVATDRLLGHKERRFVDVYPERLSLGAGEVRTVLNVLLNESLVVGPPDATLGVQPRGFKESDPVEGKSFKLASAPRIAPGALILGDEGLSLRSNRRWLTIKWSDVALAVDRGDFWGISSRTGAWVHVVFDEWRRGGEVKRKLMRHVPNDVVVKPSKQSWSMRSRTA